MSKAAAAVVLATIAALHSALAQQPRDSTRADSTRARVLDAVQVTASRRVQRVGDAPVTTEVISRADIERSGAQDLNALLTQYVGVQPEPSVVGSGGVQMQGLSSRHVLLLIDGQPMVGRIDGELDLSRIPAWMIDHVEVIKGPLSTLYGSSAMGGVINVITRNVYLARPAMTASATGGTQGRLEASTSLRGGVGDVRGLIGAGHRADDVQPGRADQSGARANRWDGNGKARWAPVDSRWSVDATLLGVREDQRWQSGQLYFFSNNSQANARATVAATSGADGANRAALTMSFSRFGHLSRQATLPEPVTDSGDVSTESLGRAEATYSIAIASGQVLDAGVDLDRAALTASRIIGGHRTTTTVEPFLQYSVDLGRLSLVPGARFSSSDQWGTHFTPKLAALYHLGGGVALRASAAAGYRAPDFKELYITFLNSAVGYVVHGNPALVPETSTNLSGGAEWNGSRAYLRVQAYTNRFNDFIESIQAPDSGQVQQFTYGNVAHGITRGADVDGGLALGVVTLDASYGYLEARDQVTNLPLLGATPRTARLGGAFDLPMGIMPSLTALYWSAAPASESSGLGGTTVLYRSAFTRLDGRIARELSAGVSGQVGVTNVFDRRPRDWPGDTARRWYVGFAVDRGF